jgi:hypothetical protein
VGEQNYYHDYGFDLTISGYTGMVYQGHFIKENLVYSSLTAGLGFFNNFKSSEVEGEKINWWTPAGSLEFGYPLKLLIRKNSDKFIADQFVTSGDKDTYSRTTRFYRIDQPEHIYFIPLAGINYCPAPYKIQPLSANSDLDSDVLYNQSVVTVNVGIKLMRIINNEVSIRDKQSNKELTGRSFKYADLYVGLNFPVKDSYETTLSYSDIVKADGPTFEAYIGLPTGYSNASGMFKIGYKSIPYVRKGMLRPIEGDTDVNTSGFGQFYCSFRFYI